MKNLIIRGDFFYIEKAAINKNMWKKGVKCYVEVEKETGCRRTNSEGK